MIRRCRITINRSLSSDADRPIITGTLRAGVGRLIGQAFPMSCSVTLYYQNNPNILRVVKKTSISSSFSQQCLLWTQKVISTIWHRNAWLQKVSMIVYPKCPYSLQSMIHSKTYTLRMVLRLVWASELPNGKSVENWNLNRTKMQMMEYSWMKT